jgi:hypothetical protein
MIIAGIQPYASATGDLNYGRLSANNVITTPSGLLLWGGAAGYTVGLLM